MERDDFGRSDTLIEPITHKTSRSIWPGAAFVVEALILLLFLAGSLAVFMGLLGQAHMRGDDDDNLSRAVMLVSNRAEQFAADPVGVAALPEEVTTEDGYVMKCTVTTEKTEGGVLYRAHISADAPGLEQIPAYEVDTARYVSEVQHG